MPRGGKRRGAGAPHNNLNALKHGRRSAQLRHVFIAATRSGPRATIRRVLDAALLLRAGLVPKRRKSAMTSHPDNDVDQAGHQTNQEAP